MNLTKNHARPLNVMERLALVENWIGNTVQPGADRRLQALEEQNFYVGAFMRAITEMLGGEEAIQAVMDRQRDEALIQQEGQQKAKTAAMLEAGKIVPVTVIGPKTIVISVEKTATEPQQVLNRRAHFLMERVAQTSPPAFADFLGKSIGDTVQVQSPNGPVIYDVIEIYEVAQEQESPAPEQSTEEPTAQIEEN